MIYLLLFIILVLVATLIYLLMILIKLTKGPNTIELLKKEVLYKQLLIQNRQLETELEYIETEHAKELNKKERKNIKPIGYGTGGG